MLSLVESMALLYASGGIMGRRPGRSKERKEGGGKCKRHVKTNRKENVGAVHPGARSGRGKINN